MKNEPKTHFRAAFYFVYNSSGVVYETKHGDGDVGLEEKRLVGWR